MRRSALFLTALVFSASCLLTVSGEDATEEKFKAALADAEVKPFPKSHTLLTVPTSLETPGLSADSRHKQAEADFDAYLERFWLQTVTSFLACVVP